MSISLAYFNLIDYIILFFFIFVIDFSPIIYMQLDYNAVVADSSEAATLSSILSHLCTSWKASSHSNMIEGSP